MRKRRRKLKKSKVGDTVDRISNLPDVLLTHILSFLSTRTSVRTSVLSKRWKHLWASVPTLDLNNWDFPPNGEDLTDQTSRKANFLTFVYRFLMQNSVSYLQKFRLICSESYDPSVIESWFCVAKKLRVQELELDTSFYEEMFELPQNLFTCEMLVVLKLEGCMVLNFLMASICFPNLKVIRLNSIAYKNDNSASNLINSSCPVLEKLFIQRFDGDNLQSLVVTAQTLKHLEVYYMPEYDFNRRLKTVIDAPALRYLDLQDELTSKYVVGDLGAVVEARLDVCTSLELDDDTLHAYCTFELVRKIRNVKYLSISYNTMVALTKADSYDLWTFHNLTRLSIYIDECSRLAQSISWKLVLEFLKSSPQLKDLVLEVIRSDYDEEFDLTLEQDVPNCLVSHLETIEIDCLWGNIDNMKLVGYFLNNSKVLKRIRIVSHYRKADRQVLARVVLKLPRGSTACQIEIV